MDRFYKYSVLRAVPNQLRGEVVNIGIVVFHDETLDVRLAPSLGKLIALDPTVDIDEFQQLPARLIEWTSRFDSVEQKFEAIKRFGIVTISETGTFRTTESLAYENHLSRLMQVLVTPSPREPSASTTNRITTSLREIFRQQDVLGKEVDDIGKHLVVPKYPISPEEDLYADFALRNGAYWITETADFRARSNGRLDNSRVASFAAIKLHKAAQKFEKNFRSSVVFAATSEADVATQLKLLGDYAGELVNLENKKALARYTQQILEVAGANRQIQPQSA